MSDEERLAIVAQGDMARVKELERVLAAGGFDSRIVSPPGQKANA